MSAPATRLRPATPEDEALLAAWREDPASPYDDFSGPETDGRDARPLGRSIVVGELLVTDGEDRPLGDVVWYAVPHGPNAGSLAYGIGISLRPEARGQGHGTRAQRMLAQYLFRTTPVHRVEASTDVGNAPEQGALARAGFTREGVLRGAQWRGGAQHDLVLFSRLRTDRPADG